MRRSGGKEMRIGAAPQNGAEAIEFLAKPRQP
uniref:Uncharacterized protein n=1 Tax=Sphingobacterium sp. (strain 21) TaxID=743722 RepID=F4C2X6_SPHS2